MFMTQLLSLFVQHELSSLLHGEKIMSEACKARVFFCLTELPPGQGFIVEALASIGLIDVAVVLVAGYYLVVGGVEDHVAVHLQQVDTEAVVFVVHTHDA